MLKEILPQALEDGGYIEDYTAEGERVEAVDLTSIEFIRDSFTDCIFENCDFSKAYFTKTQFIKCTFTNCTFKSTYFRDAFLTECKADRCDFGESFFKGTVIEKGSYCYANFERNTLEQCRISGAYRYAIFSEVKLKKTVFNSADLSNTDFFRTSLKGVDLTDCDIDGIMLSDKFSEIKGAKINTEQAIAFAQMFGIKVI